MNLPDIKLDGVILFRETQIRKRKERRVRYVSVNFPPKKHSYEVLDTEVIMLLDSELRVNPLAHSNVLRASVCFQFGKLLRKQHSLSALPIVLRASNHFRSTNVPTVGSNVLIGHKLFMYGTGRVGHINRHMGS